jgi:2-oxoglutarate ferredoxin oxidoreductase subunit alpha
VLTSADLDLMTEFHRFADEDADFVTPRTLPGLDSRGAYFVRGSGHDKYGGYTEVPDRYQEVVDRLALKHSAAADHMPAPVVERRHGARIGIITVGSCDLAVREAAEILDDDGIPVDVMRVRAFPFGGGVREFLEDHETCFVVEQNRDAQLRSLLILELGVQPSSLQSVLVYGGFPLSAKHVVDGIRNSRGD